MEDAIAGLLPLEEAIAREEKRNDVLSEKEGNVVKEEEKAEEKQLLFQIVVEVYIDRQTGTLHTNTYAKHREGDQMCHQVPSVWMEHEDVKMDAKRMETDSRDCSLLLSRKISECMNKLIVESSLEAPNILSRVSAAAGKEASSVPQKSSACEVNHQKKFVDCSVGVVYCIPLSCGRQYIGQTGCCLNVRLMKHYSTLTSTAPPFPMTTLTKHCLLCRRCDPRFDETEVLFTDEDKATREFVEVFYRSREADKSINAPVIAFDNMVKFLSQQRMLGRLECPND